MLSVAHNYQTNQPFNRNSNFSNEEIIKSWVIQDINFFYYFDQKKKNRRNNMIKQMNSMANRYIPLNLINNRQKFISTTTTTLPQIINTNPKSNPYLIPCHTTSPENTKNINPNQQNSTITNVSIRSKNISKKGRPRIYDDKNPHTKKFKTSDEVKKYIKDNRIDKETLSNTKSDIVMKMKNIFKIEPWIIVRIAKAYFSNSKGAGRPKKFCLTNEIMYKWAVDFCIRNGRLATEREIFSKARELKNEKREDLKDESDWEGSYGWAYKFYWRHYNELKGRLENKGNN